MTKFVHGEEALLQAEKITAALFSGDIKSLTADEIEQGLKKCQHSILQKRQKYCRVAS